jgi:hypothetical protein
MQNSRKQKNNMRKVETQKKKSMARFFIIGSWLITTVRGSVNY